MRHDRLARRPRGTPGPGPGEPASARLVAMAAVAPMGEAFPLLLTIAEVARVLRTSRKAVYAMAERAQLPGLTRIGRRLLVRRDDLLCWLDERRAASPGGTRR
jgi:excisionase family DNA binding protein